MRRTSNCLTTLTALALVAGLGWAAPAAAQSYTVTSGSGSFSSIATTGTPLGLTGVDDGAATFNAPAPFPFFGQMITPGTAIYVNSNGTVNVGATYSDYSNTTLPAAGGPSNFLAPFWTDLRFGSTTDAYWGLQGTDLVIEWDRVESYAVSGETISFQVRLALDGTIRFAYGPRNAGSGWSGATVGAENAAETAGVMATCANTCTPSDLPNGTIITMTPSMGPPPSGPDLIVFSTGVPSVLNAGDTIQIPFIAQNQGQSPAVPVRVSLYIGARSPVTRGDVEIASASVRSLTAGDSQEDLLTLTVPPGIPGNFAAGLIVDSRDVVVEADEANNVFDFGPITIVDGGTGALSITTSQLPRGVIGIPYDATIQTTGGTSPSFTLIEGSLPPGLSLSSSGRISGTPTAEGAFFVAVEAAEAGLSSAQAGFEIVIDNGGGGGITVTPTNLPDARVGVPYSGMMSATGGSPPYAFQVISGRPDWLTVNAQGLMSGTPDAPGEFAMTVSVFDSETADSTAVVTLRVLESGPVGLVDSLPTGVTGRPYAQPVIRGGIPPYQVTILDGAFPEGFSVDSDGVLSGQAATGGRWQVTLQVTDANTPQGSAAGAVTLEISELRPLEITATNLLIPTFNDVNVPIPVQGGIPPYSWSIVQGALPAGLSLDTQGGRITGRIEEVTTSTITFLVQDSDGANAQQPIVVVTKRQRMTDSSGSRGGSSRGGGGCVCVTEPTERPWGAAGALAALALLMVGPGRVRRRRDAQRPPGGLAPTKPFE